MTPLSRQCMTSTKQKSIHCQAWAALQPQRVEECNDAFWTMPTVNAAMRRPSEAWVNFRYGHCTTVMTRSWPLCGSKHTCQVRVLLDSRCPLCRQEDSGGHILGGCLHRDMKKQYIARHDKAMRAVV